MPIPGQITLLKPWQALSAEHSAAINEQLQRELSPGHVLYGLDATAVAMSGARDDVLFEVAGHKNPLAHVHLTWSRSPIKEPRWPATQFFASWEDWVREKLVPDHEEYSL